MVLVDIYATSWGRSMQPAVCHISTVPSVQVSPVSSCWYRDDTCSRFVLVCCDFSSGKLLGEHR